MKKSRWKLSIDMVIQTGISKKNGPEAGQYFHVRPPIGFI